ncbi:HSP20-like chaperone [Mycotypha africana]|uniref:HSP20-like chaperone n=1 Tax=Mycotypha africana TaxID=64632 RepID=UPI00230044C3|nr:HSP20-like chaperone [Mycotypha africana]KAI8991638.1 HSP20-like chaperone [Mycotypha africana]
MALSQRVFSEALRDMQRAMAVFDHPFFNGVRGSWLSNRPGGFSSNVGDDLMSSSRFPVTDLKETPTNYELVAELPGYEKKDVKIELTDSRTLLLKASKNEEHESRSTPMEDKEEAGELAQRNEDGHTWWVKERVSGSITRSFVFPTPIPAEGIKASFENGLLKVTIPKATEQQAKQINID